ncbi:MAG: hypothetical protein PHP72_08835 [Dysgonamonadaceae bacterium]|nr:hypothetical protein [Dysgonamonadaceae bacterium]
MKEIKTFIMPQIFSDKLSLYLYLLKINKRNEIYETLCLMLLNKEFRNELENLIEKIEITKTNKNINLVVKTSKEYKKAINRVCRSQYFINNFSKEEIRRKKIIAQNLIKEIGVLSLGLSIDKKYKIMCRWFDVRWPSIKHQCKKTNGLNKTTITFTDDVSLDEITQYLKINLGIKNFPKKKKLSIGQGIRLIETEKQIRSNEKSYANKKYKHIQFIVGYDNIEQLISREMFELYNENISVELVSKLLQRTKQIKKEINKISDK